MAVKSRKKKAAKRKKTAKKKSKAKKPKKDYLAKVSDDKKFWLCDGGVLSNLAQLRDALRKMNEGVFNYHVNKKRNDFKNWVKDVVGDNRLAFAIARIKSSKGMYQKVAAAVRRHAKK